MKNDSSEKCNLQQHHRSVVRSIDDVVGVCIFRSCQILCKVRFHKLIAEFFWATWLCTIQNIDQFVILFDVRAIEREHILLQIVYTLLSELWTCWSGAPCGLQGCNTVDAVVLCQSVKNCDQCWRSRWKLLHSVDSNGWHHYRHASDVWSHRQRQYCTHIFVLLSLAVVDYAVFRSTSKSRPNNIGGKMSVRPSVHKKFLRFQWNLVYR